MGSYVLIEDENATKHQQRYVGPYRIYEHTPTGSYELIDALGTETHKARPQLKSVPPPPQPIDFPTTHISVVPNMSMASIPRTTDSKEAMASSSDETKQEVPPDNKQDVFEVEKILQHAGTVGNFHYLVKWKHYDSTQNTWEPEENFNYTAVIDRYWKAQAPPKQTKQARLSAAAKKHASTIQQRATPCPIASPAIQQDDPPIPQSVVPSTSDVRMSPAAIFDYLSAFETINGCAVAHHVVLC